MSTLMDSIVSSQNQLLELTQAWQKPVLDAVNRTASFVEGQTTKLPKIPALPFADELPKPSELIEAQFSFAAKLVEANKRFALDLAGAVQQVVVAAEDRVEETPAS
jgi:hypothetical protein